MMAVKERGKVVWPARPVLECHSFELEHSAFRFQGLQPGFVTLLEEFRYLGVITKIVRYEFRGPGECLNGVGNPAVVFQARAASCQEARKFFSR